MSLRVNVARTFKALAKLLMSRFLKVIPSAAKSSEYTKILSGHLVNDSCGHSNLKTQGSGTRMNQTPLSRHFSGLLGSYR